MKHNVKKWISMLLALVMVLGLVITPAPVSAAGAADAYISDLIGYYKAYQEAAETDILRTLEEMAKVDPVQAEAWTQIMDYWSYINTEMVVNIGTVPEGLPEDNSVAIVILGFALNSDGTMKDELIGRLQTGLAIAEAYPNSYVVVTGGGTAKENPNVTEGGLMGAWLLEQGLSEDRLIIENKAPSTVGNAENTYKILAEEYPQVDSFVMVTSDYHVPRGCILFYAKCLLSAYAAGGEPLKLINNAGYYTGTNGYETISLQASGVASVAGVSASSNVKLSQLTQLKVVRAGEDLDITAIYHNGYQRNVTAKAEVEAVEGGMKVTYTENGITLSGILADGSDETLFFSVAHLEALIEQAQAISPSSYTKDSFAALTAAIEAAQALLDSGVYTLAEVDEAYTALENAIANLKSLVNVAYKMNVTANCNQKNAYKVTDGTISTSNYWAGEGENGNVPANESELIIELDGTYNLEAIRVYPYFSGQRIYQYELFASVDGENWEKVAENVSEDYATDQGFTHDVDATAAYIKLVGIRTEVVGRGDINNLHIIEIQAFGTEANNIALYKPVISSGSDQSAASSAGAAETKANDGDPSSYWDAGKYENKPWIIVDLEGLYDLDKLNVITYWKSSRYYQYELYTSVDGNEWVKVAAKESTDKETIYGETFDLSGQGIQAAYVKLVGVYNSANSAFHVNELRVYGTAHEHSYEAVVTEPTCTEGGYTTYTCECGDSYVADETEALGHSYEGVITVEPSCTEAGVMTYTCANCGDSYTEELAADGHYPVIVEGYPATCTEPGLTDGIQCCVCTEWIEPMVEIPALGHSYENGSCVNCGEEEPIQVTVIAEGWSGYTTWVLTSDGVLTFSPTEQQLDGQTNLKNYWKVNGVLTLPWGEYADQIVKVVISDGIHDIGQMAFYELKNLTEVQLGKDVTEIRNYAFKNCTALVSINLGDVDYIREGAFYGCAALENITFAEGVVIGDWAFTKTPVVLP